MKGFMVELLTASLFWSLPSCLVYVFGTSPCAVEVLGRCDTFWFENKIVVLGSFAAPETPGSINRVHM